MAGYLIEIPIFGRRRTLAIFASQSVSQFELSVMFIIHSFHWCLYSPIDNCIHIECL